MASTDETTKRLEARAREWIDAPPDRKLTIPESLTALLVSVRNEEREACAAYCLDRADQYDTNSGTWPALADAAEGIAKGEASAMLERGETEDLLARVRKMAGFTRTTRKARDR